MVAFIEERSFTTPASLVLADGTSHPGFSFGAKRSIAGEAVFQTGMVGYVEALTDPSYRGQILVLTYPLVGNYGVPSQQDKDYNDLPLHFESYQIHVAGLVVSEYCLKHSHWRAVESLASWLQREKVPAIFGVDTRAVTQLIREEGVMLGKLLVGEEDIKNADALAWVDPNERNLVAEVSRKEKSVYRANPDKFPNGPVARIMGVDVGMKYNQIRCFTERGVEFTVVPWDYQFSGEVDKYDGLFLSNGPGDPNMIKETVAEVKKVLSAQTVPIFGICLGHQLLSLSAGAKASKLKFGNRGHNIPCIDCRSGSCHITTQNHGYAVETSSLPADWDVYFYNANDNTNEGIIHRSLPFFSVQFHPESTPGPRDTEYLFDDFINQAMECRKQGKLVSYPAVEEKPKDIQLKVRKVVILGSGGLSIGQAGEFDYSGSQAIKAFKEEGITTVLINPNIATIQTSRGLADKVYFLPVDPTHVLKVVEKEQPDAIAVSFGGQTALNCGVAIKEDLKRLGVRVLGTPLEAVELTEDRAMFASLMREIGEKVAVSESATNVEDSVVAAERIGYPVIVRAAYALGGLGSGFANNRKQLVDLCTTAFSTSPQVLIERSMKGWKEVEYEVVRDINDNCITVCNMENFDPLGIHTGDSIVVAPSQTLNDREYHMLRNCAIKVIRRLGVVGECNIQYALNPESEEYCIIEVNARLSRSSALASKATGYPLAFVAAKLGLHITLPEIRNAVTQKTCACFEPSLDYLVVKMPRWDLKKFTRVNKRVGSAMKSVGEVMSISRTFEDAIQKAIRANDDANIGFYPKQLSDGVTVDEELEFPTDQRLFALANAFRDDYSIDKIHNMSKIDRWFLYKLQGIHELAEKMSKMSLSTIDFETVRDAKIKGFSDALIAKCLDSSALAVREKRIDFNIAPVTKQIDTVAAEFPAQTNYLYMTYSGSYNDIQLDPSDVSIIVLGSGVYRIGSSVEFDWCAVRCVRTMQEVGFKSVMINYNPETVSTDFDEADYLYFENIELERVLDVHTFVKPRGVIVSMGGQIANNIALPLMRQAVNVLGTSPVQIDNAENRYKFSRMCDSIGVDQPKWKELSTYDEAAAFCDEVTYPVLVRPSYVLSGAAMTVVYSPEDLENYLGKAADVSRDHPVVISKFIDEAKEIEVDAVALDGKLIMHVISEHVENAGVHSGDATLIQPPTDIDPITRRRIENVTAKIADALIVTGPFNIQFIAKNNEIKVIECNVRCSRSFPFVSKAINVDLIEMATKAILGVPVKPYPNAHSPPLEYVCVKVPQFSFSRLAGADPILGVEMASTGEVACFGRDKYEAYLKSLMSTGFKISFQSRAVLISIGPYKEKMEFLPFARKLVANGYHLYATPGTSDFLEAHDVHSEVLDVLDMEDTGIQSEQQQTTVSHYLQNNLIDLFICLPSRNRYRRPATYMSRGYQTRRLAIDRQVPLITNIKIAKIFTEAMIRYPESSKLPLNKYDYLLSHEHVSIPGMIEPMAHLNVSSENPALSMAATTDTALSAGFVHVGVLSTDRSITDTASLRKVQEGLTHILHTDISLYCEPAKGNVDPAAGLPGLADLGQNQGLYLDLRDMTDVSRISPILDQWPSHLQLVVRASGMQLAAALFVATSTSRKLHIHQVISPADLDLIASAKQQLTFMGEINGTVTCDVNPIMMCMDDEDLAAHNERQTFGKTPVTREGITALWEKISFVDMFSIGDMSLAFPHSVELVLPLLLDAVRQGLLTLQQVIDRTSANPVRYFGLPKHRATVLEVDMDKTWSFTDSDRAGADLSPFLSNPGRVFRGRLSRIKAHGQDISLDSAGSFEERQHKPLIEGREIFPMFELTRSATRPASAAAGAVTANEAYPSDGVVSKFERQTAGPAVVEGSKPLVRDGASFSLDDDEATTMANGGLLPPMRSASPSRSSAATDAIHSMTRDQSFQSIGRAAATTPTPELDSMLSPKRGAEKSGTLVSQNLTSAATMKLSTISTREGPGGFPVHLLGVKQLNRKLLHNLFQTAYEMRKMVERMGSIDILRGKVMASVFYEPSTRTQMSFQAAMERLGGSVLSINVDTSSVKKGESLADTLRCMQCYSDLIVLRHPEPGAIQQESKHLRVPLINAGDGIGEHPTQALLDLYTIREELGTVNNLTITVVGDLKHGRTVHSLVRLLTNYNVRLVYVSHPSLGMPQEIVNEVHAAGIQQSYAEDLNDVIADTDVLYVTRIQRERFPSEDEYQKHAGKLVVDVKLLKKAKDHMCILHPLPRVDEISTEVDYDPRAAYFRQMTYGMYVRMALLATMLGKA
eukprot:Clim_evm16s77 gene=Clim_evmTU16s77